MAFRARYHILTPCLQSKSDVAITNIWFYTEALRRRFIKQKCCVYDLCQYTFPIGFRKRHTTATVASFPRKVEIARIIIRITV